MKRAYKAYRVQSKVEEIRQVLLQRVMLHLHLHLSCLEADISQMPTDLTISRDVTGRPTFFYWVINNSGITKSIIKLPVNTTVPAVSFPGKW